MTVREFLQKYSKNKEIKELSVYQEPIREIDSCPALVHRYTGSVEISLGSNQNYLNFEYVYYIHQDKTGLIVICKPNVEQRQAIIDAYNS